MNPQDFEYSESGPTDTATNLKNGAQDIVRDTDTYIRANPVPAVLTALGIGFALGVLTRYIEPAPKHEPWQDALDEIRGLLATGTKKGKKAYSQSADAVREAVAQAVDKAHDVDVDLVVKFWKKLWS